MQYHHLPKKYSSWALPKIRGKFFEVEYQLFAIGKRYHDLRLLADNVDVRCNGGGGGGGGRGNDFQWSLLVTTKKWGLKIMGTRGKIVDVIHHLSPKSLHIFLATSTVLHVWNFFH